MTTGFLPPVGALAPLVEPQVAGLATSGADEVGPIGRSSGVAFAELVSGGLQRVSEQLQANQIDLQRLAAGDVENLHQVMLRMEETRLSFQLMLQVRNRLLESYQEVMRMQV